MARTRQWTIEPKIIDENNIETTEPKYNISYTGSNEAEMVFSTSSGGTNYVLTELENYRAFELTASNPVTLGIAAATTAGSIIEFSDVSNFIYKANVSVNSTTNIWYVRTSTTVVTANVVLKVITS
jgi:hypothetical protein